MQFAGENRNWRYDRIAGALGNRGYKVSDQSVGNILKRHGIPPAPQRQKTTTWKEFIRSHMDVLASTDFFTAEVWTKSGLVTYWVLFFMHLATRRVPIAGITPYPDGQRMTQVARNVTMADVGFLSPTRYLISMLSDTNTSIHTSPRVACLPRSDTPPSKQRPFEPIQGRFQRRSCGFE